MRQLWLVMALCFACQSRPVDSNFSLAAKPVEISYASYGRDEIFASHEALTRELSSYQNRPGSDSSELRLALDSWVDTLSFFIHIFPSQSENDLYAPLITGAEEGLFLLDQSANRDAVSLWVSTYSALLNSASAGLCLRDLNFEFASRRKISQKLARPFWSGVNFIPNLSGSFSSNLTGYIKAQKKAFQSDVARADNGDPLFPGHIEFIAEAYSRAQTIRIVQTRFARLDEDAHFTRERDQAEKFYGQILQDVGRFNEWQDAGQETKAAVLARKIRIDWLHALSAKRASATL